MLQRLHSLLISTMASVQLIHTTTHMHEHTRTQTHTITHMHEHTCTQSHTCTNTLAHKHTQLHICTNTLAHKHTQSHTCTNTLAHKHTQLHICTNTLAHKHTQLHICTNTLAHKHNTHRARSYYCLCIDKCLHKQSCIAYGDLTLLTGSGAFLTIPCKHMGMKTHTNTHVQTNEHTHIQTLITHTPAVLQR